MSAVFQSTGQALHVAYLIMSVEARQENHFRRALMRIIESVEQPSARLKAWLEQLRGTSSGTVDFSGLSSDEVRAQCAMVTQYVKDHLPAPERSVIHARYIPTLVADDGLTESGVPKKRIYFSPDRADGIQWLAAWLRPSFPDIEAKAMDYVVAKVFVNHSLTQISFRALAHDFGSNHMTYARAYPKIKERMKELEDMAIRRLSAKFEETGLVESILANA